MFFSALSLKVLVGLGALVGASVLARHWIIEDPKKVTLHSKQGGVVVMSELEKTAMPEPKAVVTPEQAAEKKLADLNYKIRTLDEDIGNRTSTIEILKAEMPQLEENWKEKCKNHQEDKINYGKSADIDVNRKETKNLLAKQYESQKICETAKKKFDDAKTKKSKLEGQVMNKQDIRKSLRPF